MSTRRSDYFMHFGILGQKWGVRRFQNEDGTLTEEGRRRYLENQHPNGFKFYSREAGDIYNKTLVEANKKLVPINKEWGRKRPQGLLGEDIDSLKAYLEYTKQVRDMYKETYRNVLAKDMGVDPATLKGQTWLNGLLHYNTFDIMMEELESQIAKKERRR